MLKNQYRGAISEILFQRGFYVFWSLFMLAFFVRFAALIYSDNYLGAGPMLNIITSLRIFSFSGLKDNVFYYPLPLYLYLTYLSVLIGKLQILAPRFLSLFFGSVSVLLFYAPVKRLFGKKTAFYAALILCCYPRHILMSVVSSPDIIASVFIFGALFLVLKKRYFASGLSCALAGALTSVSWLFIIPLFIYFWTEPKSSVIENSKKSLIFLIPALLVPLAVVLLSADKYRMISSPGTSGIFYANMLGADSFYSYAYAYGTLLKSILLSLFNGFPLFFVLAVFGMVVCLRKSRKNVLIYFWGALLLLSSLGLFRREIPLAKEAGFMLSILYIPFAVEALKVILFYLRLNRRAWERILYLGLCLCLLGNFISIAPRLGPQVRLLAGWLEENLGPRDIVFVEKDAAGVYSSLIMLSGLPQGNFRYLDERHKVTEVTGSFANIYVVQSKDKKLPDIFRGILLVKDTGAYVVLKNDDQEK